MSDREGHSGLPPTDDDLSLPKATVAKMITGSFLVVSPALPPAFKISANLTKPPPLPHVFPAFALTLHTLGVHIHTHTHIHTHARIHEHEQNSFPAMSLASCLEFIHLISSEANEICEQDSKKTIAPEHIIGALKVRFFPSLSVVIVMSDSSIIDCCDHTPEARLRIVHRGGRRRPQGP